MSKNHILLRTNTLVCLIIIVGFLFTSILSYRANYSTSLKNIEQISALTSEGICYQLTTIFAKPVNISLTMANDSFLKEFLSHEMENLENSNYEYTISSYLNSYRNQYNYDSVFLVSSATGRYYNFNGIDRIIAEGNPENEWYYTLQDSDKDYSLNIDNDEVAGGSNELTVFVNCKIKSEDGTVIGVIGVGLRIDYLQHFFNEYNEKFTVNASLINEDGLIEISAEHTGYQKMDFFETHGLNDIRNEVLSWRTEGEAQSLWFSASDSEAPNEYIVTRYLPALSWHLVIEYDTGLLTSQLRHQLIQTIIGILFIIIVILLVITYVIRGFNKRIMQLTEEREETFRKATEKLYDNIYELNITQNCVASASTKQHFRDLGIPKNTPYDKALKLIAEKQVKEEFRKNYINIFSPQNILYEYEKGNTHLCYDFMRNENDSRYFWMRIDAYIYHCSEDNCVYMFTYQKNINAQKVEEDRMKRQVQTDQMTQVYNKAATRHYIEALLNQNPKETYAFFIFDIDNFKTANDEHGHAFGDLVIIKFAQIIKQYFRQDDIIGRIGGDEFAAFIPVPDEVWAVHKATELCDALNSVYLSGTSSWKMSASIGIAISPEDGTSFEELYLNADTALYYTKRHGRNGYTLYRKIKQPHS